MPAIPAQLEAFTVDWLNIVLKDHLGQCRVTHCTAEAFHSPGQTAEIAQLAVEYDAPTDLPRSMIAKYTSHDPMILTEIIANYDQYRRESAFYAEFPDAGIAVPRCLFTAHDPATQAFVLLMADLSPAASPSWAANPEQVRIAASALPCFHSRWWNDGTLLQKDWMVQRDNRPFYEAAFGGAHQSGPVLDTLYEATALTREIMAVCFEKLDAVLGFVQSRPFTFVHGDYHAKQMFFPTEAGGEFAVIDWQFPFVAPGPWDLARISAMCLSTPDLKARQNDLLEDYLQGLQKGGVKDYSMADLKTDYQFGLVVSQMIMVIASVSTDYHLFETECNELGMDWRDVMFDRTHRALADWQVLDMVKAL